MGLKVIVDSLDDVDEAIKGLYKKSGDKFLLDVNNIDDHPSVSGLSKTMREERDARKKSEKSLKDIKKRTEGLDLDALKDIDLDEYKTNLVDLEKMKKEQLTKNKKKLKDKEQWEKLEQQLQDQNKIDIEDVKDVFTKQIETFKQKLEDVTQSKDTAIKEMSKSLETYLKDKEIISALAEAKGNVTVLMPHISKHVKVDKNGNDEFVAMVVDSEGTPRITDTGDHMTISEFVTELKNKPEFQGEGLFEKDKQSGGSGSQGNNNDGAGDSEVNPFSDKDFNLTQQMKLKKTNPTEYERLRVAAGS